MKPAKYYAAIVTALIAVTAMSTAFASGAAVKQTPLDPSGTWPQVFYRGADGALWSTWRDYSGNWTVQQLGGSMAGNPVAATDPNSAFVDVFWRGTDNSLWEDERDQSGNWQGPQQLGGSLLGDPCVTVLENSNGIGSWLQVFYRGTDHALWTMWLDPEGHWSSRQRLGGAVAGNPVAATAPGSTTAQVFFRGADNGLWSITRKSNGVWSGPSRLAGDLASDPSVTTVQSSAGPQSWLQVFYEASDHGLWTIWRRSDGSWSYPQLIRNGGFGPPVTATLPESTTTQTFYQGTGGALQSVWRNYDGSWAGPDRLAGFVTSVPAALSVQSDTSQTPWLQLFFRRTDSGLWSIWRNYDGSWSSPQKITGQMEGNPTAVSVSD